MLPFGIAHTGSAQLPAHARSCRRAFAQVVSLPDPTETDQCLGGWSPQLPSEFRIEMPPTCLFFFFFLIIIKRSNAPFFLLIYWPLCVFPLLHAAFFSCSVWAALWLWHMGLVAPPTP